MTEKAPWLRPWQLAALFADARDVLAAVLVRRLEDEYRALDALEKKKGMQQKAREATIGRRTDRG